MTLTIAIAHAVATLSLCGLIWFVQLVHYPLFPRVGQAQFVAYEQAHCTRTGLIVVPLMLIELASALWLACSPPTAIPRPLALAGLALLGLIWLSTALLQVPCHRRLGHGFERTTARRLVSSNWLRTLAWSARGGVAIDLLLAAARLPT